MPQQTRRPSPMDVSPPTPESLTALTQRNIELIAQLEDTAAAKRSSADRVADAIWTAAHQDEAGWQSVVAYSG